MILVTGAKGQLANELKLFLPSDKAVFLDKEECDISNLEQLEKVLDKYNIELIINCAAYTAVDKAETDSTNAFLINEKGVANLAFLTKKNNLKLIHISTDYVFGGPNFRPIKEDSKTEPNSVYGKSKLAGEEQIIKINPKAIIIRTSWLYSKFGHNFVKTILKNSKIRDSLKVVYDQVGTPTNAADLASAIMQIIPQMDGLKETELYHFSNEGVASWYDFAYAIKEIKNLKISIFPIETSEYPLPAPRPQYSVLSKNKIKDKFKLTIPHWRESLGKCLRSIGEDF